MKATADMQLGVMSNPHTACSWSRTKERSDWGWTQCPCLLACANTLDSSIEHTQNMYVLFNGAKTIIWCETESKAWQRYLGLYPHVNACNASSSQHQGQAACRVCRDIMILINIVVSSSFAGAIHVRRHELLYPTV